ncbi:MAG TPA: GatB/YqeY domain-containing protein [Steroidobacteraceae bacterium]|nr:GatB/YqeY domain-containing protein [Steroidobacteraceae bacterium]
MTLKDRITDDMKAALRAGAKERLSAIRLILAAVKQREVDERITLDDAQVLGVLEKMIKQRRESIEQFKSGGRDDLVAKESAELQLLQSYLPAQLNDGEIDAIIGEAIRASGAASIKDMGKVMAAVRPKVQGRADMGALSERVKRRLAGAGS